MASAMLKRTSMMVQSLRSYASISVGSDVTAAAPNVSLQKARSWDEGVSSKFSTTPIKDIFKVIIIILKIQFQKLTLFLIPDYNMLYFVWCSG